MVKKCIRYYIYKYTPAKSVNSLALIVTIFFRLHHISCDQFTNKLN